MADFEIRAEYTGTEPNLKPAASAFARMIRSITDADGAFTDPDLEAEYQKWISKKEPPAAATADGQERDDAQNESSEKL